MQKEPDQLEQRVPIHPLSYESGVPFFKGLFGVIGPAKETDVGYSQLRTLVELYQPGLELNAEPQFKAEEYTRELDTLWLKRIFLEASQRLIRLCGETPANREKLIAIARSLGLSEDSALDSLESPQDDSQDLQSWVDTLSIDYIAWDDHQNPNYFWSFPYDTYPIKPNALIHIYEGQALLVLHSGRVTDILQPGSHRFSPHYLPGYAEACGWSGDAVRPGFVFVKTSASPILRWGCPDGLSAETETSGAFLFMPYGRCVLSITDPGLLHQRFNAKGIIDDTDATARLRRLVSAHFVEVLSDVMKTVELDLGRFIEDIDQMRRITAPLLKSRIERIGLNLHRFEIESITLPNHVGLKPFSERGRTLGEVGNQVLGNRTTGASINTRSSRSILGSPKTSGLAETHSENEAELGNTDTSYDFAPDHDDRP